MSSVVLGGGAMEAGRRRGLQAVSPSHRMLFGIMPK
jgi:hypothetical protein